MCSWTCIEYSWARNMLGPNSLTFSCSSGASLHAMLAGGYYHYVFSNSQQILLTKEPNKHQHSSYAIVERPVLLDAC